MSSWAELQTMAFLALGENSEKIRPFEFGQEADYAQAYIAKLLPVHMNPSLAGSAIPSVSMTLAASLGVPAALVYPDDCLEVVSVRWDENDAGPLHPALILDEAREVSASEFYQTMDATSDKIYALSASVIMINSEPGSGFPIGLGARVNYKRVPTKFIDSTLNAEPMLGPEWHGTMLDMIVSKLLLRLGDAAKSSHYMAQADQKLKLIANSTGGSK